MAPRDRENNGNRESVPTENVAEKVHYIGVRKKFWGRYGAEIRNHLKKSRTWLGTYDTAEEAAKVYDAAARYLRGPFAKTNFPAPTLDSAFEMGCQDPSSIQDNSAALDCRTTVEALSNHLPALLDRLTPLAVSTDLHARPLHASSRSANRDKVKVDMGKQALPWTLAYMNVAVGMQAYMNVAVGMQGVVDPTKGSTTSACALRLPTTSPHPCHTSYLTSLLDCAATVQQPPMEMPLLAENVVSNNGLCRGMVNNLPPTTCDCYYYSSSGVIDAQVSHLPGVKNTGPNFIDLNRPPPEEDISYPAAMETTTRLLDLNILPPED